MKKMSVWDHLDELRSRLILVAVFFVVSLIAAFVFQNHLMSFVLHPFRRLADHKGQNPRNPVCELLLTAAKEQDEKNPALSKALRELSDFFAYRRLIAIRPQESFLSYFRVSLFAALVVTVPFLVFQLWRFVSAGLYEHERRAARFFLPLGVGLFFAGLAFGYLLLVPVALRFLLTYGQSEMITPRISVSGYLDFFNTVMLALGVSFQLPLGMMLVAAAGVVSAKEMKRYRRHMVVVAFIVAAALTPPDVVTQFLLAVPLVALYEFGIVLARFMGDRDESGSVRSATDGENDTV